MLTNIKSSFLCFISVCVASVALNAGLLAICRAIFAAPATFSPFFYGAVIMFTAVGVLAAWVVYLAMLWLWAKRFPARDAVRDFKWVSVVALVVSFIPDIMMPFSTDADNQGATWPIVGALMLMHVIPALLVIFGFKKRA